jgi:tRNA threonylcarbamoyladenosine biosynthesis protein TsaE
MSKPDICRISLPDAERTRSCGRSLALSLYLQPLTVLLRGELGAGKTTFLQGFAKGLGIESALTSPTYALEQRYQTKGFGELLHIDLYRLKPAQARSLLAATDDHPGIRCIEWPDRLEGDLREHFPTSIDIALAEEGSERLLEAIFRDVPFPSSEEIEQWRREVALPPNVIAHCEKVAEICDRLAQHLIERGEIVRRETLFAAAQAHDLLRFLDFSPETTPAGVVRTAEDEARWKPWRERYKGLRHEEACTAFLRERGYDAFGDIVAVHGLHAPSPTRATIEQRVLFYGDKRVIGDRLVTVEERFEEFLHRYGKGRKTPQAQFWFEETKAAERSLFPQGVPF